MNANHVVMGSIVALSLAACVAPTGGGEATSSTSQAATVGTGFHLPDTTTATVDLTPTFWDYTADPSPYDGWIRTGKTWVDAAGVVWVAWVAIDSVSRQAVHASWVASPDLGYFACLDAACVNLVDTTGNINGQAPSTNPKGGGTRLEPTFPDCPTCTLGSAITIPVDPDLVAKYLRGLDADMLACSQPTECRPLAAAAAASSTSTSSGGVGSGGTGRNSGGHVQHQQ